MDLFYHTKKNDSL